jgi:hypothetical protein
MPRRHKITPPLTTRCDARSPHLFLTCSHQDPTASKRLDPRALETDMTTTASPTLGWPTAPANTPVPHDMSCAQCRHGLHVYLACGDGCDCGPQMMPGTAA